jgi:hypothetical protein
LCANRAWLDGEPEGLGDGLVAATVIAASVPLTPLPSAHATRTVAGVVAAPSAFLGFRSRTRSPAVNVMVPGLLAVAGGAVAVWVSFRPPLAGSGYAVGVCAGH